jgi:hypothetical protein
MNAEAQCLGCNYPLRGLPENRCPECGRVFDPNNRATMNLGRPISAAARFWQNPPGWPLNIATAAVAFLLLYSYRFPGHDFLEETPWACASVLVGIVWLVRLFTFLAVGAYYRRRTIPLFGLRWAAAPLIVGVAFLLYKLDVPMHVAFWISRPAMQQLADQVIRNPNNPPKTASVGLYTAENIEAFPTGMRFIVRYRFMFGADGFQYCPATQPTGLGYRHLTGSWFTYVEPD